MVNETNKTTNTMSLKELQKLNDSRKSEMDYLEWARVIDSLEKSISDSAKSIEINTQFLKQAIVQQSKHEPPKNKNKENTV